MSLPSGGNDIVTIRQITHRLESTAASERIDALQELATFARSLPGTVGEVALDKIFQLLREQSSAEEYSEALDLISRLIKSKDESASRSNTFKLLSDSSHVELLLDLLEHEDLMVGVMTSQLLTELHSNDGPTLEAQIQHCPDGNHVYEASFNLKIGLTVSLPNF